MIFFPVGLRIEFVNKIKFKKIKKFHFEFIVFQSATLKGFQI